MEGEHGTALALECSHTVGPCWPAAVQLPTTLLPSARPTRFCTAASYGSRASTMPTEWMATSKASGTALPRPDSRGQHCNSRFVMVPAPVHWVTVSKDHPSAHTPQAPHITCHTPARCSLPLAFCAAGSILHSRPPGLTLALQIPVSACSTVPCGAGEYFTRAAQTTEGPPTTPAELRPWKAQLIA